MRKLLDRWSIYPDASDMGFRDGPKLKWYDGPHWKWKWFWRFFGYHYLWRGVLVNSGKPFKGRFVSSFEDVLVDKLADDLAVTIDREALAELERELKNEDPSHR